LSLPVTRGSSLALGLNSICNDINMSLYLSSAGLAVRWSSRSPRNERRMTVEGETNERRDADGASRPGMIVYHEHVILAYHPSPFLALSQECCRRRESHGLRPLLAAQLPMPGEPRACPGRPARCERTTRGVLASGTLDQLSPLRLGLRGSETCIHHCFGTSQQRAKPALASWDFLPCHHSARPSTWHAHYHRGAARAPRALPVARCR